MKGNQYRPAIWETVTMLLNEDTGYGLLERPLGRDRLDQKQEGSHRYHVNKDSWQASFFRLN